MGQLNAELSDFTDEPEIVTRLEGAALIYDRICDQYGFTLQQLATLNDKTFASLLTAEGATPNVVMARSLLYQILTDSTDSP